MFTGQLFVNNYLFVNIWALLSVVEHCHPFFASDSHLSYHSASSPVTYQPQCIQLLSDVMSLAFYTLSLTCSSWNLANKSGRRKSKSFYFLFMVFSFLCDHYYLSILPWLLLLLLLLIILLLLLRLSTTSSAHKQWLEKENRNLEWMTDWIYKKYIYLILAWK